MKSVGVHAQRQPQGGVLSGGFLGEEEGGKEGGKERGGRED